MVVDRADALTMHDAVVVVPGIMGSELIDVATGKVLWGLTDAGWYVSAWTGGVSLRALAVTDEERDGRTTRVRPGRLLRLSPAFAPLLRGVEPYAALLKTIGRLVADPAAVLEFAYDWRLSVRHNALLLERAAERHLHAWRAHPRGHAGARLVFVAHSMGGLIAKCVAAGIGETDLRGVITLGTPFHGAVKAVQILAHGQGVPLPHGRLRRLALTMPGIYDLLPRYRCVSEGDGVRRLAADDLAAAGGDVTLAHEALAFQQHLAGLRVAGLRTVVGVEQPTAQSLRLRDGVLECRFASLRTDVPHGAEWVDEAGDGTVFRGSAAGESAIYVAQTHGALPKTDDVLTNVRALLTERPPGAELAGPRFGLDLPDMVAVEETFEVTVRSPGDPAAATCTITEVATGQTIGSQRPRSRGEVAVARFSLPRPGLYRVAVKGGGRSAVTELMMAADELGACDA
jgi:hypothetical protein